MFTYYGSLDKNGAYAALLTDLSKSFDCLPYDLLIAKLHAYGCELLSLIFATDTNVLR